MAFLLREFQAFNMEIESIIITTINSKCSYRVTTTRVIEGDDDDDDAPYDYAPAA